MQSKKISAIKDFEEGLMPNLFGMNLLDAVYLLENNDS